MPVPSLRESDPFAWLIACEEIRQLASRYAVAIGHRDLGRSRALFVPDVRIGRELSGRAALKQNMTEQLGDGDHRTILQVTNHVIDVRDTDHATGVVDAGGDRTGRRR